MPFDRFAYPWVLALLAAAPILLVAAWWRAGRGRLLYPTAGLPVVGERSLRARLIRVPLLLRVAALALLVPALARPQDESGLVRTSTEGVALQIVIDRSSSMTRADRDRRARTNRLEAVKRGRQRVRRRQRGGPRRGARAT
jgi:Ca-activated chloride channel family protein